MESVGFAICWTCRSRVARHLLFALVWTVLHSVHPATVSALCLSARVCSRGPGGFDLRPGLDVTWMKATASP
jgi:hypothetical protein